MVLYVLAGFILGVAACGTIGFILFERKALRDMPKWRAERERAWDNSDLTPPRVTAPIDRRQQWHAVERHPHIRH